jgi:hypothetical protein
MSGTVRTYQYYRVSKLRRWVARWGLAAAIAHVPALGLSGSAHGGNNIAIVDPNGDICPTPETPSTCQQDPSGDTSTEPLAAIGAIVLLPPPATPGILLAKPPGPSTDTQSTALSPGLTQTLAKALGQALQGAPSPMANVPAQTTLAPTDTQSTPLSPSFMQALANALVEAFRSNPSPTAAAPTPTPTPALAPTVMPTPAPSGVGRVARVAGTTVSTPAAAKAGTKVTGTATCQGTLVGGGALVATGDGENSNDAELLASYASDVHTWSATAVVSNRNLGQNETLTVTAIALCAQ